MKITGKLYVIVDPQFSKDIFKLTLQTIKGGADIIQLRDKVSSTGKILKEAIKLKNICTKYGKTFLMNDRVDIAMLSDADGVHLGKTDIPINEARKLLGSKKIIGATAHNLKEAKYAVKQGADYIGYGHIFPTRSKMKKDKPKGLSELRKFVELSKASRLRQDRWALERESVPVFAIGGIDTSNAGTVMKTGVSGIAVISSICKARNPLNAAKELHNIIYG